MNICKGTQMIVDSNYNNGCKKEGQAEGHKLWIIFYILYIWNKTHAIFFTSYIFGAKHLPTVGCKYKKHKLCLGRGGRAATDASRAFSIQLDSTGPLKEHCNQCNQRKFENVSPFWLIELILLGLAILECFVCSSRKENLISSLFIAGSQA